MDLKDINQEVIQHKLMEKENAYLVSYLNIQNSKAMIDISKEDMLPRDEVQALRKLQSETEDEDEKTDLKRKIDAAIAADNGVFSNEQNLRDNERAMKIHSDNIKLLKSLITK